MRLGKKSLSNLIGVDSRLVEVVHTAVELIEFPFDFGVHEGLRTKERQEALVKSGASKTMDSRHLTGHAVDLVPYLNGQLQWKWPLIYPIAEAMRKSAQKHGLRLRWGGAWDINFTTSTDPAKELVDDYVRRRQAAGKQAFIDGPHYEIPRE